MTTLRDYQVRAVDELRDRLVAGKRRLLLVSPTGSGKTTIAADGMILPAIRRGSSVLFLAHRRELIEQCSARLRDAGVEHGIIMAGVDPLPWLHTQVASIPTLTARLGRGGALPAANLIILDEAHHARAGTYARILDAYPGAAVIGLTATPWRTDGRGLGELFEDLVVAARPRELIERGYLVPYTGLAYDTPDTSRLERKSHDYEQEGLELVMREKTIVGNVVQQYLEHGAGRRAVVFAVSVAHSRDLVARFRAAGVAAEHLDGETPVAQRDGILRRLGAGELRVVSNVGVLTEGWDCPQVEVCILARPTLSVGLYLQMVGRVMRPAVGKREARIHDHAGCIVAHGLPDADRDYSLDGDDPAAGRQGARDLPPLRTCRACFAVFEALESACPACGDASTPAPKVLREIDGPQVRAVPLHELPRFRDAHEEAQKEHYARLLAASREKGYRRGAAAMKFRAIYGRWPGPWRRELEREAGAA